MSDQIQELVSQIKMANLAYANGKPFMSDEDYDILWRQLYELAPNHPLLWHTTKSAEMGTHHHPKKILSLNKAMKMEDLKLFHTRTQFQVLTLQPKYDGVALVRYMTPDGPHWVLNGDGNDGAEVTHLLGEWSKLYGLDSPTISTWEALILNSDWDPTFGALPRSVVSGALNPSRLTPTALPITLISHTSTDYLIEVKPWEMTVESLWTLCLDKYAEWKTLFPMDGIVLKVADHHARMAMGHNNDYPFWAIAWKPPIQTAETTVESIEWNVSRNGRVVPTVIYQPVSLCGTMNSRVTGNSFDWLRVRGVAPGAVVRVGKAGEIIPQIVAIVKPAPLTPPSECPKCGGPLIYEDDHLVCTASDCIGQSITSLAYFYSAKGMNVKGLGEKSLETLLSDSYFFDLLRTKPWALLNLDADGIVAMDSILGTAITEKILVSISASLRTLNYAHLLAAFGPKASYPTALKYLKNFLFNIPATSISRPSLAALKSIIPVFTSCVSDLQSSGIELKPVPSGVLQKFVVTGEFPWPRETIISTLESRGWVYSSSVTQDTTHVFVGAYDGTTRKMIDAKRKGISTYGLSELTKIMDGEK